MKSHHVVIHAKELIVVNVKGELDLKESKSGLLKLTADPQYTDQYEVLLDLQDVDCGLSMADLYELASAMAWPDPYLATRRKVAVLMQKEAPSHPAEFLALCAQNRGMQIKSFTEAEDAANWLNADVSQEMPGS